MLLGGDIKGNYCPSLLFSYIYMSVIYTPIFISYYNKDLLSLIVYIIIGTLLVSINGSLLSGSRDTNKTHAWSLYHGASTFKSVIPYWLAC
jgi:hypothetical protein